MHPTASARMDTAREPAFPDTAPKPQPSDVGDARRRLFESKPSTKRARSGDYVNRLIRDSAIVDAHRAGLSSREISQLVGDKGQSVGPSMPTELEQRELTDVVVYLDGDVPVVLRPEHVDDRCWAVDLVDRHRSFRHDWFISVFETRRCSGVVAHGTDAC